MNKAVIAWSGGKDSVLALHEAQKQIQIEALRTQRRLLSGAAGYPLRRHPNFFGRGLATVRDRRH